MAYMFCMGQCVNCGLLFTFNPELVPSIRVSRKNGRWEPDTNGSREPLCESCVMVANQRRRAARMPMIPVLPGAYEPEKIP